MNKSVLQNFPSTLCIQYVTLNFHSSLNLVKWNKL
nr:unnamed protein product [Callosobruchus analis]